MRKYFILLLIVIITGFLSCEKLIEPRKENILTEKQLILNPHYAEGLLILAYAGIPNEYAFETDVASDDAVTNVKTSGYLRMAKGDWKSSYNPISQWEKAYQYIYSINRFIEIYESVAWSGDIRNADSITDLRNIYHLKRLKGEAYGLRAWYKLQLLQYHSGKTVDGKLLGYPIINKTIGLNDNWKLPRNTFAESVKDIFDDFDVAIANLPPVYVDGNDATVNYTSGIRFENRINGNAAWALKSRVALLAASPAFSDDNAVTWAQAATIAGDLLKNLGALLPAGKTFYKSISSKEIIWNQSRVQKSTWEQNNFPPSLFGYGQTNPSQNLVDAFPMKNGYPIFPLSASGYNLSDPYKNRDPRLSDYIVYNNSQFKTKTIYTYIDAVSDGINNLERSTRSGYYLKKLMDESVNLDPAKPASTYHTHTLVRMTEVLLNYAEAANEAWGPDGDPNGYGFTARSKIGELRSRAGITQPDAYLASITDQNSFRELVRNERRIELCFEGFRFWDIRRWNDIATMQTPVKGVYITGNGISYNYNDIEERIFTPDMIYGPIPYNETLKYDLVQNKGW